MSMWLMPDSRDLFEHLIGPLLTHGAQGGGAEDDPGAVVAGTTERLGVDHGGDAIPGVRVTVRDPIRPLRGSE